MIYSRKHNNTTSQSQIDTLLESPSIALCRIASLSVDLPDPPLPRSKNTSFLNHSIAGRCLSTSGAVRRRRSGRHFFYTAGVVPLCQVLKADAEGTGQLGGEGDGIGDGRGSQRLRSVRRRVVREAARVAAGAQALAELAAGRVALSLGGAGGLRVLVRGGVMREAAPVSARAAPL
eukprot:CAMPEP_0198213124 /NCGR_PEP_ID=MMETSP1445-20131203/28686_1 /TAXON_ID=36898 /ORGANISM="Pyramimonas sp., Strain CCMP2087" /LENGTH=175 /DNA_ID=CAMNT_0043887725 /DNA_START=99 /DNA_END=627 /DNA_ORIENTATION=+